MTLATDDWDDLLQNIATRRVVVLGDIILDAYVSGDVTRISPEAPVPVLEVTSEEYRLGGAANVAANVRSLGASVDLIGVVGEDIGAEEFLKLLRRDDIRDDGIVTDPTRPTSLKTRVIARTQQLVRLDRESRVPIAQDVRESVCDAVTDALERADAVVVADYDKGLLDESFIHEVRDAAHLRGIPIVVDPKIENFRHYHGVTCVTPNTNEAGTGAGRRIVTTDDLRAVGTQLMTTLDLGFLLITRGAQGMSLFERDRSLLRATHIPTVAREVFDVTGAGDTVVAVFSSALAAGANPAAAARLANYAAGITVAQLGCATVKPNELREVLSERADADMSGIVSEIL
jgi:D-beta-D-heptose 7-phosphate kinase/D-beta-D-heptose 1-phosphate adenosyltransferase